MKNEELLHRLNAGQTKKCWVLHVRPKKPAENKLPYKWDNVLFTDENKYWKAYNRYLNFKWDIKSTEIRLPLEFVDKNLPCQIV